MKANTFAVELAMARKRKRLTQEEACRVIGLSEPSVLSRLENGKETPNIDTVIHLARIYEAPMIFQAYLRHKQIDDLMPYLIPNNEMIHTEDLRVIGMNVQKEYNDVSDEMPRLIKILYDGIIDSTERGEYEGFITQAKELIGVLVPLILRNEIQNKKPSQDGRLERAFA